MTKMVESGVHPYGIQSRQILNAILLETLPAARFAIGTQQTSIMCAPTRTTPTEPRAATRDPAAPANLDRSLGVKEAPVRSSTRARSPHPAGIPGGHWQLVWGGKTKEAPPKELLPRPGGNLRLMQELP